MHTIDEMNSWSYKKAWLFFSKNDYKKDIPEAREYLYDLPFCLTEDLRCDEHAREKILAAFQRKSLVLIDGASLNGKSTLAQRLSKVSNVSVVDIDIICQDWIEKQLANCSNSFSRIAFFFNIEALTDEYIYNNLERIIKEKSGKGSVVLVGSYMQLITRAIISKTLGKYFDQVVSIYCCAKTFDEVKVMKRKREQQFGYAATDEQVLEEYNYAKQLLENNGIVLGLGMNYSFISDNSVTNKFI